jgi:DNA mismatch endonuclease (patch repair protein)
MAPLPPPPPASSPHTLKVMRRMPRRDTKPELAIRRELHRRGLRYRVDAAPLRGLRCRADVVFGPARVALFVDSCFFHSCPEHATVPRANRDWWVEKLRRNVERDARNNRALTDAGWLVIRCWEHEAPAAVADLVEAAVRARRARRRAQPDAPAER